LEKIKDSLAGNLPHGYQKVLGVARDLAVRPKLLMLDEPSLGLAPQIVQSLVPIIKHINRQDVSVLLVEQNIQLALKVADTAYALQVGKVVLAGGIEKFKDNDIVQKAYLGA
jgi:branched-chain amino acid transport system ATP-binding protein